MTTLQSHIGAAKRARRTVSAHKAKMRLIALGLRETAGRTLLAIDQVPPSANNLFANIPNAGRIKTKLYKAWLKAGIQELRSIQQAPLVKGRVRICYVIERPAHARDLDNFIKPLTDLLVKAEIIEDDSKVESFDVRWGTNRGVQIAITTA